MADRFAAVLIDPATGAPYTAIPVNIGSTVNRTASGNITSTQSVALSTAACGSAAFQVSGTWTGTLDFEYTIDDATWHSLSVTPDGGGAPVSSTTTNGNWSVQVESYSQVRIRGNTVTLGSAAVFLSASTSTSVVSIASPLPVGDNTIGRVKVTDGTDVAAVTVAGALSVDASASASLPLPTGAATLAEQLTSNAFLDNISTNTPALVGGRVPVDGSGVTQPVSGTVNANAGTGTFAVSAVSLPLPSGAATSALQTTGNTSLSSIDGKTPSLGQALMAASVPVAIASNQSAVSVSGTVAVSNAFALDATLTGGGQKSQVTDGTNSAAVVNAAPTTQYGLVVRNVPAAATAPSAVQLSDGLASYTAAKTGQLPTSLGQTTAAGSVSVTLPSDKATAAAPLGVQLSDGSAAYTGAKTGQLPTALGATTKAASLSVAPATDSVGTAGSASSTVYTVQGVASMTAVQVTPPAGIGQQTLAKSISVGLNSNQVGTAGSASSTVVTVQGVASMTPVQVSGAGASGAAVTGNPVLAAGSDGTNARTLATDTAGRLRPAVYSYGRVTSLSSTTIKSGAGVLRIVNIQYTGVAHSLVLYDNTASSGTQIAAITIPAGSSLVSLSYNLAFSTGLTAQFGTAAGDVTIMYE